MEVKYENNRRISSDSFNESGSLIPRQTERLPCGSASSKRTRWPFFASPTPRLTVVVVFATPPFWLTIAITLQWSTVFSPFNFDCFIFWLVCYFSLNPTHRGNIRRLRANQTHGNSTPAGFSASSVEKYHYALQRSSPPPKAIRLLLYKLDRSLLEEISAGLQHWLSICKECIWWMRIQLSKYTEVGFWKTKSLSSVDRQREWRILNQKPKIF